MLVWYIITSIKVNLIGGEQMIQSNKVLEMAKNNNGTVTSKMVEEQNINRGILKYICDKGELEKTSRGVYVLPTSWDDEFINLQSRFKKGIFSHETALFLHDLTDRTPINFNMTFPAGYNQTMAKKHNVKCYQNKLDIYESGIISTLTPLGNKVKVYCIEKTLCDILLTRNKVDTGVISTAFKRYKDNNNKNVPLLSQYAKLLKVEEKVRIYMEILL